MGFLKKKVDNDLLTALIRLQEMQEKVLQS